MLPIVSLWRSLRTRSKTSIVSAGDCATACSRSLSGEGGCATAGAAIIRMAMTRHRSLPRACMRMVRMTTRA